MSTTYEPGTVAKVTIRRLMVDGKPRANDAGDTYLAFWDGYNRQWVSAEAGALTTAGDFWHFDVRPLVVLDLDAYEFACERPLPAGWLRAVADRAEREGGASPNIRFVRWLADQIEAQTKPPRIPEPGLWGVVEAHPGTRAGRPVDLIRGLHA